MRNFYTQCGGQRYVLVLMTLVLSAFLLWEKRLSSPDFALIVIGTVGAYIAGRTYQKTKIDEYK
jgi:drug/metabolite transporter (DMT)-like permease